ncbi:ABC transporter substrate-binding protein [Bifidobacterium amazonense]|uniref:ABC transporter substrate-binding protein n=1 Tax=Bifidobacterium amazonense TaxID=2809027 RepID=A0ABS9VXD7_9BIFI|nr:ABC transporter substrate-binding protein [Bifidobacterium amazonense]MCH9276780.1 ABC transporter substrate-binding protein [Bifidobacterium amazonense]
MGDNRILRGVSRGGTHRGRLTALAVAGLLALAGCGSTANATGGEEPAGEPQSGGTLRIAEPTEILNCIDPFQTSWTASRTLVRQFAESLTDQDPKTGEIKPWLATGWKLSDDGKTYTFDLKHGVTFSNGEAFNADAVVKNFETNLKGVKEGWGTAGGNYIQGLESVSKVDDDTVQFHFSKFNAAFLQATATTTLAILAPASLDQTPQQRCHGENLYGTGPFVLKQWDITSKTIFTKRKGYTTPSPFETRQQGDAYLDRIEVSYIPETTVRTGNFVGGQTDIILASSAVPILENDAEQIKAAGGRIETRALPGTSYDIYPNTRSEDRPLHDINVRKAVSLAIDRTSYAQTIFRKDYPTVKGVLGATTPSFQATPDAIRYDPEEAGKLLDKAGWTLNKKDGYRYKDGKKLTLVWLDYNKNAGQDLLVDQFRQVGIDLQIEIGTYADSLNKEKTNDYDLSMLWTYTRSDPVAIANLIDIRNDKGNRGGWNIANDEQRATLNKLFDAGIAERDDAKRTKIYQELQQYLADQYIQIPFYERMGDLALAKNVHGVRYTAESFISLYDTWLS